jgi:hypothetical protein
MTLVFFVGIARIATGFEHFRDNLGNNAWLVASAASAACLLGQMLALQVRITATERRIARIQAFLLRIRMIQRGQFHTS